MWWIKYYYKFLSKQNKKVIWELWGAILIKIILEFFEDNSKIFKWTNIYQCIFMLVSKCCLTFTSINLNYLHRFLIKSDITFIFVTDFCKLYFVTVILLLSNIHYYNVINII